MAQPVTRRLRPLADRRRSPRFGDSVLTVVQRATLRPGHDVTVLDLSARGARVQTTRPLGPGSGVQLQLVTASGRLSLPARVTRCVVWALDACEGVLYRGALEFTEPCTLVCVEEETAGPSEPASGGGSRIQT